MIACAMGAAKTDLDHVSRDVTPCSRRKIYHGSHHIILVSCPSNRDVVLHQRDEAARVTGTVQLGRYVGWSDAVHPYTEMRKLACKVERHALCRSLAGGVQMALDLRRDVKGGYGGVVDDAPPPFGLAAVTGRGNEVR